MSINGLSGKTIMQGGVTLNNVADGLQPNTGSTDAVSRLKVTSPHTLSSINTGQFLIFDEEDATINIPDGLTEGTNVLVTNIGNGGVTFVMTGSETTKGSLVLGDSDGVIAITKITQDTWQSSERS